MRERPEELFRMLAEKRQRRRRRLAVLTALAVLTGGSVYWNLHEIGIALNDEALSELQEPPDACIGGAETAAAETPEIWELTLPAQTGLTRSELAAQIAESQLGYTESTQNYVIGPDGVRHGYTRYGEWYGNPYGEWNTMFTYFCIYYAGVTADEIPFGGNARTWQISLTERELLRPPDTGPERGSIILLDADADGQADRTGIVTGTGETVTVIEGDLADTAAAAEYAPDDAQILGYAAIPEPEPPPDTPPLTYSAESPSGISVQAAAEEGTFPPDTVMTVRDVPREEALQTAQENLEAETLDAVAVDISFLDADGTEIEPAGSVAVQIMLPETQQLEGGSYSLLHVADDGSVENVAAETDGDAVMFTAESFSVYIITSLDTDGTGNHALDAIYVNGRYFGNFANSANNRYIMYIGDTLDIVFDRTDGYTSIANNRANDKDKLLKITENTEYTWTDNGTEKTGHRKIYQANAAGDCEVEYNVNGEVAERRLYVTVREPVYIQTYFTEKPSNKTREWLPGKGLTNYEGYVINKPDQPFLLRVGDTAQMHYKTDSGIWLSQNSTSAQDQYSNTGNATSISLVGNQTWTDGVSYWTIRGDKPGLSCVNIGIEKVYVYVIGDNTISTSTYNHADMEIADGGQYTLTTVTYDGQGRRFTTVAVYDAYVSNVNHSFVYGEDNTQLAEFLSDDYEPLNSEGSTQYELTSAYACYKFPGRNYNYDINQVEHVVFDVDITLVPKMRYMISENNSVVSESIAGQEQITVNNVIYDLGKQSIIDAMNKCPLKNGLDFTVQPNAALVQVEAYKELDTGETPPAGDFTFTLSEFTHKFYRMPTDDAHTLQIQNYDPTHTYEVYRLNLLANGPQGWGDGIDGWAYYNQVGKSIFGPDAAQIGAQIQHYADPQNAPAAVSTLDEETFVTDLLPFLTPENALHPDSSGRVAGVTGDCIVIDITNPVLSAENEADGTVLLNQSYSVAGVHRYAVRETSGNGSYVYDNLTQFITVSVMRENAAGDALAAEVKYPYSTGQHPITFHNKVTYTLPATGGRGSLPYTLCGTGMIAAALLLRRRRKEEA